MVIAVNAFPGTANIALSPKVKNMANWNKALLETM